MENKGYLEGVPQTFDEKNFDLLLGNWDIDGDLAVQDIINVYGVANKRNTILESGDLTKGFKGSNGNVTYDNRGNMTYDASCGLSISYNFLDLPILISNSMGRMEFTYDASGNLLTKTVTYNAGPSPVPTMTDYVKVLQICEMENPIRKRLYKFVR